MGDINIGLVGSGNISKIHILGLKAMDIIFDDIDVKHNFKGICTRSGVDKFGIFDYATDDLNELLEDKSINMVDICTPNFLHLEQGSKAIRADKNIYMEKPIAKNLAEGEKLVELCKSKDVINQVALMYRFVPSVVMAKDYIRDGKLGEILNFRVTLYHKGYLNEERPISWRLKNDKSGGGALMDLGIHMADLVRFLLGEVKDVRGRTSTYFKERYKDSSLTEKVSADVDEWALLDINLKNGGYGTLEVSRISSDITEDTVFEVYGTKGKLKISTDHMDYPEIFLHDKGHLLKGELERTSDFSKYHKSIFPSAKFDMGWNLNAHMSSLINFILNIKQNKIVHSETPTLEEGLKSQKIIEMGYISAREGNRVVKSDEILL
ncbi:Gfo/Idh/MocA family protein [Sporosalibacterium faouarense]|uniref:Gfo/Idh/MocA family protein n=1 Tax=Sporosalibacterium faouarense TaxID=516123 RepID=UPI00192CD8A4|nr:Gfo/Idh/MocA family oxidoreductase [Sporosalibacterium faouarense]